MAQVTLSISDNHWAGWGRRRITPVSYTHLRFFFGINGVVTFKKSSLAEVLPHIPLDRIVLETDSPYLAPVPFRGKRNESSYIKNVAMKLAEIYGLDFKDVDRITANNALKAVSYTHLVLEKEAAF